MSYYLTAIMVFPLAMFAKPILGIWLTNIPDHSVAFTQIILYTMLIASHDLDFIYDTCDRVLLLSNGKLVADGPTQDILTNKKFLEENGLELPLSFSR